MRETGRQRDMHTGSLSEPQIYVYQRTNATIVFIIDKSVSYFLDYCSLNISGCWTLSQKEEDVTLDFKNL